MWSFVVITGASRGFGRSCAVSYAKSALNPIHFMLTGRSIQDLNITKEIIIKNWKIDVSLLKIDLVGSDLAGDDCTSIAIQLFEQPFKENNDNKQYDKFIFINNAGALGPLRPISDEITYEDFKNSFHFNISSSSYFSAQAVGRFKSNKLPSTIEKFIIVNVSSLAAVQSFESWGIYCAGKAARDMFHRVIADENKSNKNIMILNYAPGPLDTDMQKEIREGENVIDDVKQVFISMKNENKLIHPDTSADVLHYLIQRESFESGSHVDYYDVSVDSQLKTGSTTCNCEPTCNCGPDCNCATQKSQPSKLCKAGDVCTCGPNCDCSATGRPGCNACAEAVAASRGEVKQVPKHSCCCGESCSCGPDCQCSKE